MGFDFEGILGTSGAGLAEAYEDTVADVIYFDELIEDLLEMPSPQLVTDETPPRTHEDIDTQLCSPSVTPLHPAGTQTADVSDTVRCFVRYSTPDRG